MADGIADASHSRRRDGAAIAAATLVTTLDGFDAFSFNLVALLLRADLGLSTAALGPLFASVLAGMIVGATGGGALADKIGRLKVLMAALVIFGGAALLLPLAASGTEVILNRLVAGVGLGAAAPVAIGLLNRFASKPPSELVIACVMAGIPLGGCFAALFNYAVVPTTGWRSIFVVGGALPLPVALLALWVFRGADKRAVVEATKGRLSDVFAHGQGRSALVIAAMFFFGYVITAVVSNWLPTILTQRGASPLVVSATFGALNIGSVVGMLMLGLIASRTQLLNLVPIVWAAAAVMGLATMLGEMGTTGIAMLAIVGYTVAAGGQALSVALTNKAYRDRGMETTAIGLMTAVGRLGQASALGASGMVISATGQDTSVFAMAGACGVLAALLGITAVRSRPRSSTRVKSSHVRQSAAS